MCTTRLGPHDRCAPTMLDYVPPSPRTFAVGRLDYESEGLLLLTNDGTFCQLVSSPAVAMRKVVGATPPPTPPPAAAAAAAAAAPRTCPSALVVPSSLSNPSMSTQHPPTVSLTTHRPRRLQINANFYTSILNHAAHLAVRPTVC